MEPMLKSGFAPTQDQDHRHLSVSLVDLEVDSNDKVSSLSAGKQKLVAVARALAANPDILLFDEPTTGLDPVNTRRIFSLIRKLKTELVPLVVTHDILAALEFADRILILDQGRVVALGTPIGIRNSLRPSGRRSIASSGHDYSCPRHSTRRRTAPPSGRIGQLFRSSALW